MFYFKEICNMLNYNRKLLIDRLFEAIFKDIYIRKDYFNLICKYENKIEKYLTTSQKEVLNILKKGVVYGYNGNNECSNKPSAKKNL